MTKQPVPPKSKAASPAHRTPSSTSRAPTVAPTKLGPQPPARGQRVSITLIRSRQAVARLQALHDRSQGKAVGSASIRSRSTEQAAQRYQRALVAATAHLLLMTPKRRAAVAGCLVRQIQHSGRMDGLEGLLLTCTIDQLQADPSGQLYQKAKELWSSPGLPSVLGGGASSALVSSLAEGRLYTVGATGFASLASSLPSPGAGTSSDVLNEPGISGGEDADGKDVCQKVAYAVGVALGVAAVGGKLASDAAGSEVDSGQQLGEDISSLQDMLADGKEFASFGAAVSGFAGTFVCGYFAADPTTTTTTLRDGTNQTVTVSGGVTTVTNSGTDADGNHVTEVVDSNGNVSQTTTNAQDGSVTTITYNSSSETLTSTTTEPDGSSTTTVLNSDGTSTTTDIDASGGTTVTSYDANGNQTGQTTYGASGTSGGTDDGGTDDTTDVCGETGDPPAPDPDDSSDGGYIAGDFDDSSNDGSGPIRIDLNGGDPVDDASTGTDSGGKLDTGKLGGKGGDPIDAPPASGHAALDPSKLRDGSSDPDPVDDGAGTGGHGPLAPPSGIGVELPGMPTAAETASALVPSGTGFRIADLPQVGASGITSFGFAADLPSLEGSIAAATSAVNSILASAASQTAVPAGASAGRSALVSGAMPAGITTTLLRAGAASLAKAQARLPAAVSAVRSPRTE